MEITPEQEPPPPASPSPVATAEPSTASAPPPAAAPRRSAASPRQLRGTVIPAQPPDGAGRKSASPSIDTERVSDFDRLRIRLWPWFPRSRRARTLLTAVALPLAVIVGISAVIVGINTQQTIAGGTQRTHIDPGPPIGHTGVVYSVAFSPDGKTLATGSYDNTARLWDLTSHHQTR